MPDLYFVECNCGQHLRVELFEAGTTTVCPACRAAVDIPNSVRLKELAGDRYPTLSSLEKVQRAIANGEPPFEGHCHGCDRVPAEYVVPIVFDVLVERQVVGYMGVRPTLTGGIKLTAEPTEETWQATTIPLMLCTECHSAFRAAEAREHWSAWGKVLSFYGLLVASLTLAYFHFELAVMLFGILGVVGYAVWNAGLRLAPQPIPRFLPHWLAGIRWLPEAIAAEDEFKLSVGQSQQLERTRNGAGDNPPRD